MSQKTWGGRFTGGTDARVEAFTESISFDRRLYRHDIIGSQAHARMLAEVGLLTTDEAGQIVSALDEIGAIDPGNSHALLSMLDKHKINLVSAAPEGSENILAIFKNHYEILEHFEIQRCVPITRRTHRVN